VNFIAKAVGTLASLLAGLLGAKLVSSLWRRTTGEEPPTLANPEVQQRANIGKVLAFAVISGASASVIQAVTKRWTKRIGQSSTGS
jgi:hypothetical protein